MPEPETPASLHDELALIRHAAVEAGRIAMRYYRGEHALDVQWKSGNSPVTEADFAVNDYLTRTLREARPDYGWLSEETPDSDARARIEARRTFIIDPIDGTRAFMEGRDSWCISIAIVEGTRSVAGVLECPALAETYWATEGGGAHSGGTRLIHEDDYVPERLIVAGPRKPCDDLAATASIPVLHHRHIPSLAYRIAMVADGRLTGTYIRPNAHDWDIAAADIILREAGGILLNADATPVSLNGEIAKKPFMVAARAGMGQTMLSVVGPGTFG